MLLPPRGSIPASLRPGLPCSAALLAWRSSDVRLPFRPRLASVRQGLMCSSFPSHLHHSRGFSREAGSIGKLSWPRSPAEGHPAIAAGLCPAPALGPGGHGVWGSQAASCVCNTEQMFKLKGVGRTKLFSEKSKFLPFLSQSPNSCICTPPHPPGIPVQWRQVREESHSF